MVLALNLFAYLMILLAAALRLNAMHWRNDSPAEIALWWWLAMSAFAGLVFVEHDPTWQQVTFAMSAAGLMVYYLQPVWRRWLADRRRGARRGEHARGRMSFHPPLDDH